MEQYGGEKQRLFKLDSSKSYPAGLPPAAGYVGRRKKMTIWMGEGIETFILQLTPETMEETVMLARLGISAKTVDKQKLGAAFLYDTHKMLGEIIVPKKKMPETMQIK